MPSTGQLTSQIVRQDQIFQFVSHVLHIVSACDFAFGGFHNGKNTGAEFSTSLVYDYVLFDKTWSDRSGRDSSNQQHQQESVDSNIISSSNNPCVHGMRQVHC